MTLIIPKPTPEQEVACEKALDDFFDGLNYIPDDLPEEIDALIDSSIRQMKK